MGMGLPTVAAYVIGAVFFVPALKDLGFSEISSNFFVMYYCVLSMLTPPVALASYTAAGIASANNFKTSVEAFKKSFVIFLIPICFLFDENILLINFELFNFLISIIGLCLVTFSWVFFLEGYIKRRISIISRLTFLLIIFLLIYYKFDPTIIGVSSAIFIINYLLTNKINS